MKIEINMNELNQLISLYDDANSAAHIASEKVEDIIGLAKDSYDGGPYVHIDVDVLSELLGYDLRRSAE